MSPVTLQEWPAANFPSLCFYFPRVFLFWVLSMQARRKAVDCSIFYGDTTL